MTDDRGFDPKSCFFFIPAWDLPHEEGRRQPDELRLDGLVGRGVGAEQQLLDRSPLQRAQLGVVAILES